MCVPCEAHVSRRYLGFVTSIRHATPDDAAAVARLLHDFNSEYDDFTPGVEVLAQNARDMLVEGDMVVLLAGDGPDGFAELRFRKSVWTAKLDCYLEELYVVPELRGQGIGREILREAMATARALGATHMDLGTSESDEAARALYESEGFDCHEGKSSGAACALLRARTLGAWIDLFGGKDGLRPVPSHPRKENTCTSDSERCSSSSSSSFSSPRTRNQPRIEEAQMYIGLGTLLLIIIIIILVT